MPDVFPKNSKNTLNFSHNSIFDVYSHDFKNNGIDSLVDLKTFKKQFSLLSQPDLDKSSILAIKILEVEVIYLKSTLEEFYFALTEVVHSIICIFNTDCKSVAYAGNGIFFVLSNKCLLKSSLSHEIEIQKFIDSKNLEYDNSDPLNIIISVGNPIWPSKNAMQPEGLIFSSAIVRAENRSQRIIDDSKVHPSHSFYSSLV